MTKQKGNSRGSKLARYMKAPLRFLLKARDMYVLGMINCSRNLSYVEASMGCPTTGQLYSIPRCFSVNTARSSASDYDFKELVRAASLRSHGNRVETLMTVPRSRSVGLGRIQEAEPCEFGDDIKVRPHIYPRSRSYAIRSIHTQEY